MRNGGGFVKEERESFLGGADGELGLEGSGEIGWALEPSRTIGRPQPYDSCCSMYYGRGPWMKVIIDLLWFARQEKLMDYVGLCVICFLKLEAVTCFICKE